MGADLDWEWETDDREGLLRLLAKQYGSILMDNSELMNKVIAMLDSPIWRIRKSALYTLMSIPDGLPLHLLPKIHNLFNDMRDHKSWLLRIQIAELFVDHHDKEVSHYSINLLTRALDYATKAEEKGWEDGSKVRKQAVSFLGQLDASSCDDVIFTKLALVMQNDPDPDVRDAAYGALLRLAAAPEATTDL